MKVGFCILGQVFSFWAGYGVCLHCYPMAIFIAAIVTLINMILMSMKSKEEA